MTNTELITGYREIVFDIHAMKQRLAWNRRHGLPELNIPEQIRELIRELIRFEELMETITDRRARNVICCRFVLGMSVRSTADYLRLSCNTVERICTATLRSLE